MLRAIRCRQAALYDEEKKRHVLKDAIITFSLKTGKVVEVIDWEHDTARSSWRIEEAEGSGDGERLLVHALAAVGDEKGGNRREKVLRIPLEDVGNAILMPGVVDISASVCDPGPRSWGNFDSVSRVAASGGVTTIVDLPVFNSIPTTSLGALEAKLEAAKGRVYVDCGLTAGLTNNNAEEIAGESLRQVPRLCFHGNQIAFLLSHHCLYLVKVASVSHPWAS